MATIKDIAKLAGVSQGTVSNVLNGKSNVSSKKIKLVEQAAADLGYTVNEKAKLLRKGSSKILAVILPNINFKSYVDFYMSFKIFAETHGYSVLQYITNDNQKTEKDILEQIKSSLAAGTVTISCLENAADYYSDRGFTSNNVVFVERKPGRECSFIGFDYAKGGTDMAKYAVEKGFASVSLLTGNLQYTNEKEFFNAFKVQMQFSQKPFSHIQTDMQRKNQNALQLFNSTSPDAVFISNYGFAETVKDTWKNFYRSTNISICTIAPVFTMPEDDFTKYELNYRLLGKEAARVLIEQLETQRTCSHKVLQNYGFRNWFGKEFMVSTVPESINVLTLDSPEASIMQNLAQLYTEKTGTRINVAVFSYDELYDITSTLDTASIYDVIRLDIAWLPWFAKRILLPLSSIDPSISCVSDLYLDGVWNTYAFVDDAVYALPSTPSMQLLFYRTDLFESTVLKRLYREQYKTHLSIPKTFEELNNIAKFFTQANNANSPVEFGATLTLGSSGVACSEFLARFYSHSDSLFDENGKLNIDCESGRVTLSELIGLRNFSSPKHSKWWKDTAYEFSQGKSAMAILYSNYASDLLSHSSKVTGNIGYALLPGKFPVIGGGSLGISKHSKKADAALSFIKWMSSEQVSSAATLLGSASACKRTYENYEIIDAFPWLSLVEYGFSSSVSVKNYEKTHIIDNRRLYNLIGKAVKSVDCGVIDIDDALRIAQQEYNDFNNENNNGV